MTKTATKKAPKSKTATKPAKVAKAAPAKKAKANGEAKAKKVSAIDAAAQVLASAKKPMNCKEPIDAMVAKGLWISPGARRRTPRFIPQYSGR